MNVLENKKAIKSWENEWVGESEDAPEKLEEWEKEWKGMPEFVQNRKDPYFKIVVRFECKEDLEDFGRRIEQQINDKTKSIWHPKLIHGRHSKKRFSTESNIIKEAYE